MFARLARGCPSLPGPCATAGHESPVDGQPPADRTMDFDQQYPRVLDTNQQGRRDAGGLPIKTLPETGDERCTCDDERHRADLAAGNAAEDLIRRTLSDRLACEYGPTHRDPPKGADDKPLYAKGGFALLPNEPGQAQEHRFNQHDDGLGSPARHTR